MASKETMTNDITNRPASAAKLNDQEWLFVEAYLSRFNATQAARAAFG
jgi:hypothetical protein